MAKPVLLLRQQPRSPSIPAAGGAPIENLSAAFDEDPSIVDWTADGLFFSRVAAHTWPYLYSIDPATKRDHQARARRPVDRIGLQPHATTDGRRRSSRATRPTLPEIYVSPLAPIAADES